MKTTTISTVTAILILCCIVSPSTAVSVPSMPSSDNKEELPTAADMAVDEEDTTDKFKLSSILDEDEFIREETEKNRVITIDWNGNETVSTDEEVMEALEFARLDTSSFLSNEPHFTGGREKRRIIGTDDRYHRSSIRNAPYSAIGYLSSPVRRCTAYVIGPSHLVTAAHCLHPSGRPGAIYNARDLFFLLGGDCGIRGMWYTISQVVVYSQYINSSNEDYDIAYLLVYANFSSWMGIAYRDPMPTVSGEICGYPGDKDNWCFYCSRCSDVQRTGWRIFRNDKRLRYTCDTKGGMSGSPVMTGDHDSTSHLYSYGVHTHGLRTHNRGVRISRNYFNDVCRWMCNTGATCSVLC